MVAKIEVRGSGIRQTRIVDMVNGMQVTGRVAAELTRWRRRHLRVLYCTPAPELFVAMDGGIHFSK